MEFGLSLGSNLGDRLANLRRASDEIASLPGLEIVAQSAVYETEPVDVSAALRDLDFLNAALAVVSDMDPSGLAKELHSIEDRMGRVRTSDRNAPREIDIDIIYAGDLVLHGDELTVPHPRWNERRFVVQPLCDIRPDLELPESGHTVREILLSLPEKPNVVVYTRDW